MAKLFCEQKIELMRCVKERETAKARAALFRLLTIVLLQHFDEPEALRLAILEISLALFDSALDEGIGVEEMVLIRHGLSSGWEGVNDPESLCLWIIRALEKVSESLAAARRAKSPDLLERVVRFIESHLSEDLSAEKVAQEVCLSESRLMHRLRKEHNISLGRCITGSRIDAAKLLLRKTTLPLSRIAQEVGYREQSYFTRVFKKSIGETPQEYRKRVSP